MSSRASLLGLLFLNTIAIVAAQDVSQIIAKFPAFSRFGSLMNSTGVITEVNSRSSLTILMPPNTVMDEFVAAHPSYTIQEVADVVRYHVLLQYLETAELKTIQANGGQVTTLYQTTGRVQGMEGFVNITDQPNGSVLVGPPTPGVAPQAAILNNVTQYPYNYSFFQINGVLVPTGLAAAPVVPVPAPVPVPSPAPSIAPVPAVTAPAPATVPTMAPVPGVPVPAPALTPVLTPTPVPAPVMTPTPVPAPSMMPVTSPVVSPPAPPPTGPSPDDTITPTAAPAGNGSSACSLRVQFVALAAFLFTGFLLL